MAWSGALRLLERLPGRPCLVVLNYHRIGEPAKNPFDDEVLSATAVRFDEQIAWLKSHLAPLSIEELVELPLQGFRLKRPSFLITFDDGYRDNFEVALPILRRHSVPAVFFIVTSMLTRPHAPWWDFIAYVVKETSQPVLRIEGELPLTVDVTRLGRARATEQILKAVKWAGRLDHNRFLSTVARVARIDATPGELGQDLFMTPGMVREMVASGMAIGAHTHSHQILAHLTPEEQRVEMGRCRARLGEILAQPPELLSYPVGGRSAFTDVTRQLAREAGYRLAFSYYGGLCWPGHMDPWDVPREPVDHSTPFLLTRARVALQRRFPGDPRSARRLGGRGRPRTPA